MNFSNKFNVVFVSILLGVLSFTPIANCQNIFDDLITTKDELKIIELDSLNKSLKDSLDIMIKDIYWAIDYIDSLETELQKEKQNIKIRTVKEEVIVTETLRDTIRLTQSGFDVDRVYQIDFNGTKYKNGSVLQVIGDTKFKWDFETNTPITPTTSINTFKLNLNVYTELIPKANTYIIETQPTTPEIRITQNSGNILTEKDYIKKVPTKLGVGLVGGFGFSYQGLTPYAGIGITYSFYDVGKLFKRREN